MSYPQSQKNPRKAQEPKDEEVDSSQDTNLEFLKNARELMAAAKKKRESKRKSVQDEHVKRTKEVAQKINVLFDTRKNRVAKMQRSQWDRLGALNKKRMSLEAQIIVSMKSIEQHTANICSELSAMLDGRKEDALELQTLN